MTASETPRRILAIPLAVRSAFFGDGTFKYESEDTKRRQYLALWEVGTPLLLFPVLTFVVATVWLMAGGTITRPASWIILGISAVAALLLMRAPGSDGWIFAPAVSLVLAALSLLLSWAVYDTSLDGQHYHFQAIYALAEGWNPYRDTSAPPALIEQATLWVIHYPRAAWVVSANLLSAGLPLATVKAVNFLVFFASGALALGVLLRFGFAWPVAGLLAGAALCNPIMLSQLFTGMNDGLFGLCILVFIISMVTWGFYRDTFALMVGLAAMTMALNLKFSAIPVFALLAAAVCIGTYLAHGRMTAMTSVAMLFAAGLIAVVLLGWSPYMQNVLQFGHVFYPLMGPRALDIMMSNTPDVLDGLSAAQRFLYSLFAETHAGYETAARLKPPFVLLPGELRAAGGVDVRIGGFGPLFSGIVVLAVACAAALVVREDRREPAVLTLLYIAAVLLLSVVLMPQNWWARYVPQLWLVPVCLAGAAICTSSRLLRIFGIAIGLIMLVNAGVVAGASTWLAGKRSTAVSMQLSELARAQQIYCMALADYSYKQLDGRPESRLYLMREFGIKARYVPRTALSCSAPQDIAAYGPDRFGGTICACSP